MERKGRGEVLDLFSKMDGIIETNHLHHISEYILIDFVLKAISPVALRRKIWNSIKDEKYSLTRKALYGFMVKYIRDFYAYAVDYYPKIYAYAVDYYPKFPCAGSDNISLRSQRTRAPFKDYPGDAWFTGRHATSTCPICKDDLRGSIYDMKENVATGAEDGVDTDSYSFRLPCEHGVHRHCFQKAWDEQGGDESFWAAKFCCPEKTCGYRLTLPEVRVAVGVFNFDWALAMANYAKSIWGEMVPKIMRVPQGQVLQEIEKMAGLAPKICALSIFAKKRTRAAERQEKFPTEEQRASTGVRPADAEKKEQPSIAKLSGRQQEWDAMTDNMRAVAEQHAEAQRRAAEQQHAVEEQRVVQERRAVQKRKLAVLQESEARVVRQKLLLLRQRLLRQARTVKGSLAATAAPALREWQTGIAADCLIGACLGLRQRVSAIAVMVFGAPGPPGVDMVAGAA